MSNRAALELDNVSRHFPGNPPVHALDGVSLTIQPGELTAIVGPSGSGKSTLMNVIGTLDRPTSGEVRIDGVPTTSMTDTRLAGLRSARIGSVFQQFHLLEGANLVDNVAAGLLYRGVARRDRRRRAITALERVGLGHRLSHRPPQLSGGERQRVVIARAIVGKPAIILADEPTGNLDSVTSVAIIDLLAQLHYEGATILIITHEPDIAARCPRQITVRDGQIINDSQTAVIEEPTA
ncbi:MAG TPA: ABC transporter ATP-binding protein [Acidimicrobiia bacterium]|jgi:putative ABC transport system ATP-binding protein|nr:ABC transporter ATP-binding protein [Acidimicrobiia bacterium]